MIKINPKIKNNFEFEGVWNGCEIEIDINPDISILDDYVSFFVDELLREYNSETVIYKNPNGYIYYTENHELHKTLNFSSDGKKSKASFGLKKYDVVEPFKKYNQKFGVVKVMPSKSKKITLEQLRVELVAICNHVINKKINIVNRIFSSSYLDKFFDGQNVEVEIKHKDDSHEKTYEFTQYVQKNKNSNNILTCDIKRKDKHIGGYNDFSEVSKEVKDEIFNYLTQKIGDDLILNLMDGDLDYFASTLNLSVYSNEEYDGESFVYSDSFDFGKYKITFYSECYIKDRSICDSKIGSMDIFLK